MSETDATTALRQAAELSAATRRAGRWYTTYLTVFAVATFAMCIGFGLMGGRWAVIVLTPIWVLLVVALSVWSARQRSVSPVWAGFTPGSSVAGPWPGA